MREVHNLDSTLRSWKAKFFQSFIPPQMRAAVQIGFLYLKALYLSFQKNFFEMDFFAKFNLFPVTFFADGSEKTIFTQITTHKS